MPRVYAQPLSETSGCGWCQVDSGVSILRGLVGLSFLQDFRVLGEEGVLRRQQGVGMA